MSAFNPDPEVVNRLLDEALRPLFPRAVVRLNCRVLVRRIGDRPDATIIFVLDGYERIEAALRIRGGIEAGAYRNSEKAVALAERLEDFQGTPEVPRDEVREFLDGY